MKLASEFYMRDNLVQVAKELLGKVLFTKFNGVITAGVITETEAYAGVNDRASHAYKDRRTKRTEVMYAEGGTAYVYLCYGIHHLFNVVTNKKDTPHAVLIRSVKPLTGVDVIRKRRGKVLADSTLCKGPGTVSEGLGIKTSHSGLSLLGDQIWIEDKAVVIRQRDIIKSPRIGVDYAGADALLPYRFTVKI
jgi:DNA-3-methyladenine glycosylase